MNPKWFLYFAATCVFVAQYRVYVAAREAAVNANDELRASVTDLRKEIDLLKGPDLWLYERDPQDWRGHEGKSDPKIRLDGLARLEVGVGTVQRFNPNIMSPEGLRNVNVFITFPPQVEVSGRDEQGRERELQCWWKAEISDTGTTYTTKVPFGDVGLGTMGSPCNEAFFVRLPTAGRVNFDYTITGATERLGTFRPIARSVRVVAK